MSTKTKGLIPGGLTTHEQYYRLTAPTALWDSYVPTKLNLIYQDAVFHIDQTAESFAAFLSEFCGAAECLQFSLQCVLFEGYAKLYLSRFSKLAAPAIIEFAAPITCAPIRDSELLFPLSSGSTALVFDQGSVRLRVFFSSSEYAIDCLDCFFPGAELRPLSSGYSVQLHNLGEYYLPLTYSL